MSVGDYKHSEQTFNEISFFCKHCTSSILLDSPAKHIKNWHNKDQNSMKTTTDVRRVTLSTQFFFYTSCDFFFDLHQLNILQSVSVK